MTPRDLLIERLPRAGRVLVQGCAGESALLAGAVADAGDALGALTFTGLQVPGVNRRAWLPNAASRFETFFMTPELQAARPRVDFLPFPYRAILAHLSRVPIDAALFAVSPPDDAGMCSFGPAVDFLAALWPRIPLRLAHVNPSLPRTAGRGIPLADLTVVSDAPEPPIAVPEPSADPVTAAIARHVAGFIGDGATIQTGIGKLPGAILRALGDRRRLRLHTGLIGDAALALLEGGAVDHGADITTGVALGTPAFYAALPASGIAFRPVSHTHDWRVIAAQRDFVAINGAVSVDLFGQACSEAIGDTWNSGVGGASDFAAGAALGGGLSIVALPAEARGASRIVPPGAGEGPVTLTRHEVHIVVTEHGAADLRGLDHDARAAALVAVAAPDHREPLARAWRDGPANY